MFALANKNVSIIAASHSAFEYNVRTEERKTEFRILSYFSHFPLSSVVSTAFAFILNRV
jgi:hypothetical protein